MSAEDGLDLGGVRRAVAELAHPMARLVADFVGAEEVATELEPGLPLLDVDLFGGLALRGRAARAEAERSSRRAPSPLSGLAAAVRLAAAAGSATRPEGKSPDVAAGGPRRRVDTAPTTPAASDAPLFRLAGSESALAAASRAGVAAWRKSTAAVVAEGDAAAETAAAPSAVAAIHDAAGAAAGAVALIAELTESILAASGAKAAGAAARTGLSGLKAAGRAAAQPQTTEGGAESVSAFLAETLRSLGHETASAFGVEPTTAERRPETGTGEDAAGTAPLPAAGAPAETTTPHAPPQNGAAAPAAVGAGPGIVPRPGEAETDPAAVAALVNDALVEQARRHGLELG